MSHFAPFKGSHREARLNVPKVPSKGSVLLWDFLGPTDVYLLWIENSDKLEKHSTQIHHDRRWGLACLPHMHEAVD